MKVLIVKTSSLGDIIHTFPALTDAGHVFPEIQFDWVVEESFSELPALHPLVGRVIPVALRRWRKGWLKFFFSKEWKSVRAALKATSYDYVIDAQGLLKSAWLTPFTRGKRCGLGWRSAWEPLAALFYQKKVFVDPKQHAIMRMRKLFSAVLGYDVDADKVDYGIDARGIVTQASQVPYILFFHGTTWVTKQWPEAYWVALAKQLVGLGYEIKIPWGNTQEQARAVRMAQTCDQIAVLSKGDLKALAAMVAGATAVIGVDTGLTHLSAALGIPTVSLYGPTHYKEVGTIGVRQVSLQGADCLKQCTSKVCAKEITDDISPDCFKEVTPEQVLSALEKLTLPISSQTQIKSSQAAPAIKHPGDRHS